MTLHDDQYPKIRDRNPPPTPRIDAYAASYIYRWLRFKWSLLS